MKKIIAFVLLAALILAAFTILPLPSVRADTSEVKVLSNYSYYTAPANPVLAANAGDIVVVGEIENVGSNIVQNVTLGGTAMDASGKTIASTEAGLALSYEMAPGQKAPFFIDFTPQSSTSSNTNWMSSLSKITVTVLTVTDTATSAYPDLNVPATPFNLTQNGLFTIVGTIVNNGTETMDYVWVVTTFYNAVGTVVGLNYTYAITPAAVLIPGGAVRWEATPADDTAQMTSQIASFTYVIDSEPVGSSNPSQTPSPTPKATSGPSSFPVLPVVVVVVVVIAVAAALLLLRKQQPTETPEAPLPPPPPPPPEP